MKNNLRHMLICGIVASLCCSLPARGAVKKQELTSAQKKRIQKTKEDMKEFVKASTVVANSFYEQGQFFEEQGMDDEAVKQYRNALAMKPPFSDMIHYNIALIYYRQDLLEQSAAELQESIALNPDYLYSHFWLGIVAIELEDYQSAVEQFENTLKINPEFYDSFYYIGLAYERSGRNPEKAASLYKRYLLLQPQGSKAAEARKSLKHLEPLIAELQAQRPRHPVKEQNAPKKPAGVMTGAAAPLTADVPAAPQKLPDIAPADSAEISTRPVEPPAVEVILEQDEETPGAPPAGQQTYTAAENETLWIIAGHADVYDNDTLWPYIYEANKDILKGKKHLTKGTLLKIPKLDQSVRARKPAASPKPVKCKPRPKNTSASAEPQRKVTPKQLPAQHTVVEGENLWIIAGYPQYYNDDSKWTFIYEANKKIVKDKKTLLQKGLVLTIPKLPENIAADSQKMPDTAPRKIPPGAGIKTAVAQPAVFTNRPVPLPPSGSSAPEPMTRIQPSHILDAARSAASFWVQSMLGAFGGMQGAMSNTAHTLKTTPAAAAVPAAAHKKTAAGDHPLKKTVTQVAATADAPAEIPEQKEKQAAASAVKPAQVTVKKTSLPQTAAPAKKDEPAPQAISGTADTAKLPSQTQKPPAPGGKFSLAAPLQIFFPPEKPRATLVEQQIQEQKLAQKTTRQETATPPAAAASSKKTESPQTDKRPSVKQTEVKLAPSVQQPAQKTKEKPASQTSETQAVKKIEKKKAAAEGEKASKKAANEKVVKVTSFGKQKKAAAGKTKASPKSTESSPRQ